MARFRFVDRSPSEPEWKAVHRAADRGIPSLRDPFLAEIENLRDQISVDDMEVLIQQGGDAAAVGAIEWIQFEVALTASFLPAMRTIQHNAMKGLLGSIEDETQADQVVLTKQDVVARFDLTNPSSVRVAAEQAALAVRQISDSTRKAIREIIKRGQMGQLTVRDQARKIRELIGLTERQTASVLNFRNSLIEQGISGQRLERMVSRKYDQTLKRRAMNIARTESINAANAGQLDIWNQAADQGLVDRDTAQKRWITSLDDRACPICVPMDGQLRPLNEPFTSPFNGASTMSPSIHSSCRCAMSLEVPE